MKEEMVTELIQMQLAPDNKISMRPVSRKGQIEGGSYLEHMERDFAIWGRKLEREWPDRRIATINILLSEESAGLLIEEVEEAFADENLNYEDFLQTAYRVYMDEQAGQTEQDAPVEETQEDAPVEETQEDPPAEETQRIHRRNKRIHQ